MRFVAIASVIHSHLPETVNNMTIAHNIAFLLCAFADLNRIEPEAMQN